MNKMVTFVLCFFFVSEHFLLRASEWSAKGALASQRIFIISAKEIIFLVSSEKT